MEVHALTVLMGVSSVSVSTDGLGITARSMWMTASINLACMVGYAMIGWDISSVNANMEKLVSEKHVEKLV